ncbi:hypothetical protein [Nonomuraea soli]|uniref:Uncharacterized protein n=1 Tax=Nonomuraea soli TaxID=1032476 RepID=A0A7W0CSL2_9ACTN|nr:hypothetical protein [Nonomuraea soli]MBA2896429.1 hypothetical protein [Nonomuraea soli]
MITISIQNSPFSAGAEDAVARRPLHEGIAVEKIAQEFSLRNDNLIWAALDYIGVKALTKRCVLDEEMVAEFRAELTARIAGLPRPPLPPLSEEEMRGHGAPGPKITTWAWRVPRGVAAAWAERRKAEEVEFQRERSENALRLEGEILQKWERLVRRQPRSRRDRLAWLCEVTGMERFQVAFAKSVRDWIAHPPSRQLSLGVLEEARRVLIEMERKLSGRG